MKRSIRVQIALLLVLGLAAIVTSCNKGPAQKVGEKIDNAVQDTKDDLNRKQ